MKIQDICRFMESFAPTALSESWDNVGLLCGDRSAPCSRVMTCLTVTPESANEAVERGAQLIVSHHPIPFRPMKSLTEDETVGHLLRTLIRADVAIYSPHTSFDSATRGINQQIAEALGLSSILPFVPHPEADGGTGRFGEFPQPIDLGTFLSRVKTLFRLPYVQYVGAPSASVRRVGIGCGAAGDFFKHALRTKCDVFLTGEANFHTCLESKARSLPLVLMTHFAGERFACENLAQILKEELPDLESVWACESEVEPIATFF
ncbi:MAG: Nif3-like dinuclear metal center hexameric protein [Planctomycetia bacterium]|nr:Nif3-like dinuclear metal center hexameric protein [Planctomycetia bacterium]